MEQGVSVPHSWMDDLDHQHRPARHHHEAKQKAPHQGAEACGHHHGQLIEPRFHSFSLILKTFFIDFLLQGALGGRGFASKDLKQRCSEL